MTDQEKKEFQEVTGFNSPEEMLAYEQGYEAAQQAMMKYIAEWKGETNSALGTALNPALKRVQALRKEH